MLLPRHAIPSFAAALLAAAPLFAQTNRGAISGEVTDPSRAVVPGATVTIANKQTNETRTVTTSQTGGYYAADLEPVDYRIRVTAPGFKAAVIDDVKVNTATTATANVVLETGPVTAEITVTASAAAVNAESGTTSATITEREIQDAPLVNRSVLDLALVLPNVAGDAGSENPTIVTTTTCPGCNLTLNGGRPLSTLMMADGTNNTGVSLGRTMVSFSPEVVQEFTVQTSAYSAEFGSTGGGVVTVTTKSGSNQFNGAALWYNRNPAFAAAPFTTSAANRPIPTLKYNQFSIAAGGPVILPKIYKGTNRTFWFAAFEPFYRRDHLDQYALLPTDAMRQGVFSGLVNTPSGWLAQSVVDQFKSIAPTAVTPLDSTLYNQFSQSGNQFSPAPAPSGNATYPTFPNNIIPKSMLDASALKALSLIAPPGPYFLNSNGLISNFVTPRVLRQDEKRYTVRIDQIIAASNRLYGRYTATPIVKTQLTPVSPTTDTAEYSWAKQAMLADTHTISPTMFNDIRLNYTRGRFSTTAAPEYDADAGENLNAVLGLPNISKGGVPLITGLFPGSSFGGGGSTATGLGSGGSTSLDDREERYAANDILYKAAGNMSWKFGVEYSRSLQNVLPLFGALGGSYGFSAMQTNSNGSTSGTGGNPFASFLLGVPNGNVSLRTALVPYYYRWNAGAAFVQNDWKVRPGFTLNLGFRYSLEMPRTEKFNNQGVFLLDRAQQVNLPTPLTLSDGEVISSTLVPPFGFAGRAGISKYLTPPDYLDFEPRFGFAWNPRSIAEGRLAVRGGYGLSHAPVGGSYRLPQPDFGATSAFASTVPSSTANPNYLMRLGENPPSLVAQTPAQVIAAPANGLVTLNSLYYQQAVGGFAVSRDYHTPYIQNWNLTVSYQLDPRTVIEAAYVGAKGTHLFEPHEDVNPKDPYLISAQIAANLNSTGTITDPLGRTNPATGQVLTVQNGSLGSPYLGFSSLYLLYEAAANSIRHAGYVSLIRRVSAGLSLVTNYTYGKSIDDSSSDGGDKNVLSASNGQVDGQVAFGGTRKSDRSVSIFDQRHVLNAFAIYDLPFGPGRRFLNHVFKPIELAAGGWTLSGIYRNTSGFPYAPSLADSNQLGDLTHTIRPDIVPGVPLVNPLWSPSCPVSSACQPYVNPAAFMRPALGQLGTAPRTLDGVRGPWVQTFDLSVQKNFRLGEKRRLQFRVDALNTFNHPAFQLVPNNAGGTDWNTSVAPSTAALSASDYNLWAVANNQPLASTPNGMALLSQINAMVNAQKNAAGVLPANFFQLPAPRNFYGLQPANFDITTLNGYKLFRLRQAYNPGFGDLYVPFTPRFIQFGLKLYF